MTETPKQRRVRADALRNREHILRAAGALVAEEGPTVPLEAIARRAGVGIATLYRHFTDRTVLLRQVVVDAFHQAAGAATAALAEEPDAFAALARYLHDAIDMRIGMIMPALKDRLLVDDDLHAAREAATNALTALVRAAHDEGSLRPDVGAGDISLLIIRMTPPLPVAISPEDNRRLSHRQLELVLDGLLRFVAGESLPGRSMGLDELGFGSRTGDRHDGQGLAGEVTARDVDTAGRSTTSGS